MIISKGLPGQLKLFPQASGTLNALPAPCSPTMLKPPSTSSSYDGGYDSDSSSSSEYSHGSSSSSSSSSSSTAEGLSNYRLAKEQLCPRSI